MKFRKFGKTVLTAALGSAVVFSLSSCIRSFTAGYLYVTGTVTATPSGNGIISGFKIDNNTGNLIAMHGLPVSSGGSNPVRAVLLTGGRFMYVLNQGVSPNAGVACGATLSDGTVNICQNPNITQFVIGGNGILTPQETFYSQGNNPFRLLQDSSGLFLFVLDHDAPAGTYCGSIVPGATSCGDITVFSINQTTGRLSLVTNAQLTTSTGNQVTYFPVPAEPIDMNFASGYVFTVSGNHGAPTGQTVYPYTYNSGNGQLTVSQSVPQVINNGEGAPMGAATAINYAGSKIYILDNEPLSVTANGTTTTSPSQVLPFTIGTNGALQALTGGAVQDDPTMSNPIYMIEESKNKFIYVANQTGAASSDSAGIAGFFIDPASNQLSFIAGEPFGTGNGPQCLLEDPSNQYIYTANADSTITGRLLDPNSGVLNNVHGWTGTAQLTGPATWCLTTGRTN